MKNTIKSLLRESLNEYIENKGFLVYHGSPTKIEKFMDDFVGSEKANDREGPGIYMTNYFDDANHYGEYVYTLRISPRKLLDETPKEKIKFNVRSTLYKLLKMAEDWKGKAQNYAENPETGLKVAIDGMIDYNDNEKDIFLQAWIEFYRYNPVQFVRNMVKLGIDGLIVDRPDFEWDNTKHFIIYNPNIIEVVEIKDTHEK